MKRIICSILTFVLVLSASAGDWRLEKINSIKKNSAYLYGEATVSTLEQATTLAYEELQREVYAWLQNDSLSVKDINRLSDTVMVRIVNVYRVFAYVEKSKLKSLPPDTVKKDTVQAKVPSAEKTLEKKDSMLFTDSVRQVINKRFFGKEGKMKQRENDALLRLKKAKNFFELKEIMQPLKDKGDIIDYGKYATAKHPELCYLIVYDPAGNICALLGKGKDIRKNLKTGNDDSIKNYRGCGAIWFTLREDDKMKN